jgi:hypothetical protein
VLVRDVHRLEAAHLLVEGVEELLPRGRARERGAVEQRPAEAAEVEQPSGVRLNGTPMRSSMNTMPGAASAMPFTGGWSARKSPP